MIYTLGNARSIYFTDEGRVFIAYVRDELLEPVHCLDLIPTDTVLFIQITLKKKPLLSSLHIDETRFITFDPSEPPKIGFRAYVDDEDGIAVCTQDGKVNEITYYAAAGDRQVCPALHSDPKQFCRVLVDFMKRESGYAETDQEQKKKSKP